MRSRSLPKNNYWKGKNVLVTGAGGFIGGNLAKALQERGARVVGLVLNLDRSSLLFFDGVAERAKLVQGSVTDIALLKRVLIEDDIRCVFHLAAQVEVGVAREYPYPTWETNVRGTYTLMEALRESGKSVESVIVASTDKAYGDYGRDKMPYQEEYPLKPVYPYDVSKACADMIARSYASGLYSLPVVVTRFCNIYGPGQLNFSALIPDAVRSALGYSRFVPRGNGLQVRDFIYVGDVADLYMTIAAELAARKSELAGEVFNAGTNEPKRVKDVLQAVFRIAGNNPGYRRIEKLFMDRKTSGEIGCQYMDFKKVNRFFGWKPRTSFEAGLLETFRWYQKYLAANLRAPRSTSLRENLAKEKRARPTAAEREIQPLSAKYR